MSALKPERLPVYAALDALPAPIFAALLMAITGLNDVLAAVVLDDPSPSRALDMAMRPFVERAPTTPAGETP